MSPLNRSPCRDGLSSSCFKSFPKWAKQAFAYRLLHYLYPPEITSKLPGVLTKPLLYPGPEFPEGWKPSDPLPEGTFIDTEILFPPDWQTDDPLPDTITSPPAIDLPTGWQPGDILPIDFNFVLETIFGIDWEIGDLWPDSLFIFKPIDLPADMILTDGSTVAPGTTFPPTAVIPADWQPGDPLPPGASGFPDWSPGDPTPGVLSFAPGYALPKFYHRGDPIPPGLEVNTRDLFPPGWTFNDPLPPGVFLDTALFFPDGWEPGDGYLSAFYLTPGMSIPENMYSLYADSPYGLYAPGNLFPPDWKPGDALPPWVSYRLDLIFPAGWYPGAPLPIGLMVDFLFMLPPGWDPGAPMQFGWGYPTVRPEVLYENGPYAYIFTLEGIFAYRSNKSTPPLVLLIIALDEDCSTIDTELWTVQPIGDLEFEAVTGRWHYKRNSGGPLVTLFYVEPLVVADNVDIWVTYENISGTGFFRLSVYTGTYQLRFRIYPPTTIKLYESSGEVEYTVDNFVDEVITVKIEMRSGLQTLKLNNVAIATNKLCFESTSLSGYIFNSHEGDAEHYIGEIQVRV